MTYFGIARAAWQRILYGGAGDAGTLVKVQTPLHVQQQLEGAVTYVAEFQTAGKQSGILDRGETVYITNVLYSSETDVDPYETRDIFVGIINNVQATSFPHQVGVTCVGPLSKLRRVRETDLVLTTLTDGEAVQIILAYCGIDFDPDLILEDGRFPLGPILPVIWKKGQSGADMLNEIDRVFGFATIERGDGIVIRLPYSLAPSDYADGLYTSRGTGGAVDTAKNFERGTPGLTFYGNERSRGGLDEIRNFVTVKGPTWNGPPDTPTANCEYQIVAEVKVEHAVLGPGVYQSDGDFTSDLIQYETQAKVIAARLMRWYNRAPNLIRVDCGNDPRIMVGDLIGVQDPVHGIDITDMERFVVTGLSREGDFMTLDCVGGSAGAEGTVTSGITVCCGTQREDGTCVDEGSNPDNPGGNDPGIPDLPPLGDCDPLTNVNCIPGGDDDPSDDPNYIDPLSGCTREGMFVECDPESLDYETCVDTLTNSLACVGSVPPDVCTRGSISGNEWMEQTDSDVGVGYACDCIVVVPWRRFSGTPFFRVDPFTHGVDAMAALGGAGGNASVFLNDLTDPASQTSATDTVLPVPLISSVSGTILFNQPGATLTLAIYSKIGGSRGGVPSSSCIIYGTPGSSISPAFSTTTYTIGGKLDLELESPLKVGDGPVNHNYGIGLRDNGGYVRDMAPPGIGDPCSFSWSIDQAYHNGWGRAVIQSSSGGGHIEHIDYLSELAEHHLPGEPTDTPSIVCGDSHDGHYLLVSLASPTAGTFDEMAVILTDLVIGIQDCVSNPDYNPPIADVGT